MPSINLNRPAVFARNNQVNAACYDPSNCTRFETRSEEETIELGRRIAAALPKRAVVLLIGNLGRGQNHARQRHCQRIGRSRPGRRIQSNLYPDSRLPRRLSHRFVSARSCRSKWRLWDSQDIFDRESVVLIEWGERFPELMPGYRLEIRLRAPGEQTRGGGSDMDRGALTGTFATFNVARYRLLLQ